MNKILVEVKNLISENLSKYLPDVKSADLEENGMVYYMNGKNGTEFDWYVNEHLSDFMVFYNDEKNMGAAKMLVYADGKAMIYIYGEQGAKLIQEIETKVNATENEILDLAIILTAEADMRDIFDGSIERIDSDAKVSNDKIERFRESGKYLEEQFGKR